MAERIERIGVSKYTITVNANGEINLDTGGAGKVTVNGDLDVKGLTTTIDSTEIAIADKTFTINKNDTNAPGGGDNAGIDDLGDGYGRSAGLIIGRGPDANDALMFYDESLAPGFRGGGAISTGNEGAFVFKLANDSLASIHVTSVMTKADEDLELGVSGTGIVTAKTNSNYERNIWTYTGDEILQANLDNPSDDDALVNARGLIDYIRDYRLYNFQHKIETGTATPTSVTVFDMDNAVTDPFYNATSQVQVAVDGNNIATFFDGRMTVNDIQISGKTITNAGVNQDIILTGSGTGNVQIDGWQNFTEEADPATPPAEGTTIYSKTLGDGGTGLYFYNTDGTTDEFVSRSKALLYSIIF